MISFGNGRAPLLVLGFALVVGVSEAPAAQQPPAPRPQPNIIFIFADDHATQAIGACGSKINQTPGIDRIASEGAVFRNSFCANSICGPSRACVLTGKHSHANGFLRNADSFNGGQTTFPKLLQRAGYQTALIGKWHLSSVPTGFDHWEYLDGGYYNPDFFQMDGTRKPHHGYCTDLITDKSLGWLEERSKSGKPFLLMCQYTAPHRNWSPHPRHFALYKEDLPVPPTLFDDYSGRSALLQESEMSIRNHFDWGWDMKFHGPCLFPEYFTSRDKRNSQYERMTAEQKQVWDAQYEPENQAFIEKMRAGSLSEKQITVWKYQRYMKDYLRCIAAVDEGVGRILEFLDKTGQAENTVVVYSADQGFYMGEHGWFDKRWMFEESLQMPFLIRWPGVVSPGSKSDALIQNIDYAPTFLEMAGAAVPAEMQGRSLVPVLARQGRAPADWRDAIYYAYYENARSHNVALHDGVRTERYKLMYFPRTREWNLFDLEKDPQELKSLHNDASYVEVLAGLQKRYRDLRSLYDVNSAAIPVTRGDEPKWKERNNLLTRQVRADAASIRLAFLGDSITQGWEAAGKAVWDRHYSGRGAVNLGIGGDRTEHVLWRLTNGNWENIKPEVAVLLIGTNNTGHLMQDPQDVAAGVECILDVLARQAPETKIILHAIFPRGRSRFEPARLNNIAINDRIRLLADGKRVHWLDIGDEFLTDSGAIPESLMPDALHLSEEGYRLWAQALEPKLNELGFNALDPVGRESAVRSAGEKNP